MITKKIALLPLVLYYSIDVFTIDDMYTWTLIRKFITSQESQKDEQKIYSWQKKKAFTFTDALEEFRSSNKKLLVSAQQSTIPSEDSDDQALSEQ